MYCLLSPSYIHTTWQIFVQRNQSYAVSFNNRVNLPTIKLKDENII